MKYSWKGHKVRNSHKNRIKRSGQAWLPNVKNISRNIPTTWRWARGDNFKKKSWRPASSQNIDLFKLYASDILIFFFLSAMCLLLQHEHIWALQIVIVIIIIIVFIPVALYFLSILEVSSLGEYLCLFHPPPTFLKEKSFFSIESHAGVLYTQIVGFVWESNTIEQCRSRVFSRCFNTSSH